MIRYEKYMTENTQKLQDTFHASATIQKVQDKVTRTRNGQLHDGPKGEPALEEYDAGGKLVRILHCDKGRDHNGPSGIAEKVWTGNGTTVFIRRALWNVPTNGPRGEPAIEKYHPESGHIAEIQYYTDGQLNDPNPKTPAIQTWHSNGARSFAVHIRNGRKQDPRAGVPAVQAWDENGRLLKSEHFNNGRRVDPSQKPRTVWQPPMQPAVPGQRK